MNPKWALHLQGDGDSLPEQRPGREDIHIYPFNVVSYPSPSRWILVSLQRRRTIPIVQLLLEERWRDRKLNIGHDVVMPIA